LASFTWKEAPEAPVGVNEPLFHTDNQKKELEKKKTLLNSDHCFHRAISEALVLPGR